MARNKVDIFAKTKGILTALNEDLSKLRDSYGHEETPDGKAQIVTNALKAYSDVMDNLSKHYKGRDEAVEALKGTARGHYEFFKGIREEQAANAILLANAQRERTKQLEQENVETIARLKQEAESKLHAPINSVIQVEPSRKEQEEAQKRELALQEERIQQQEKANLERLARLKEETERQQKALREETERRQEAERQQKAQREDRIQRIIKPVDDVITEYTNKLNGPEKVFNSKSTKAAVEGILADVRTARDAYLETLQQVVGNVGKENEAGDVFKDACRQAMSKDNRKSTLEKDITWSEYFKDFFKMLYNAVVFIPRVALNPCGFHVGRYNYAQAETATDSAEFESSLGLN